MEAGPYFYRYQRDGYGEHADGAPFDGRGIGRLWPLLSGDNVPRTDMFVITDPQSPGHTARELFIAEIVGQSRAS